MGNLRDKYTDEEWDILVEESKQHKFLIEPTTHTLTKQELIDLIIYVKVYGSYSTPDKVLDVYMETLSPEKHLKAVEKEIPVVSDWDDLELVDTDIKFTEDGGRQNGEYGLCISRYYLKENYPNGVIIKTK